MHQHDVTIVASPFVAKNITILRYKKKQKAKNLLHYNDCIEMNNIFRYDKLKNEWRKWKCVVMNEVLMIKNLSIVCFLVSQKASRFMWVASERGWNCINDCIHHHSLWWVRAAYTQKKSKFPDMPFQSVSKIYKFLRFQIHKKFVFFFWHTIDDVCIIMTNILNRFAKFFFHFFTASLNAFHLLHFV